ncbi:MAG: LytR/AlgR family response regulator transcription factor, partial [Saprospiraceae bacterium]
TLKQLVSAHIKDYKKAYTVKKKEGVFLLKTEEIAYFQAQGDFVLAFDLKNKRHVINQTLSSIEEGLDPARFFRINRSELVHIEAIEKYAPYTKNRLAIGMKTSDQDLFTSNSRSPDFRVWFESQ